MPQCRALKLRHFIYRQCAQYPRGKIRNAKIKEFFTQFHGSDSTTKFLNRAYDLLGKGRHSVTLDHGVGSHISIKINSHAKPRDSRKVRKCYA